MQKLISSKGAMVTVSTAIFMAVMSVATNAFATDPVTDAFASGQTSLTGYITAGIAVIVAVLLAGLGVGLLVKYLRKAVRAA